MFSQERGEASGDPSARASLDASGRRWQSRTADIGGRGGIVSLPPTGCVAAARGGVAPPPPTPFAAVTPDNDVEKVTV